TTSSPFTPVVAAASGNVPSYDVPIIPTFPVDHEVAFTSSLPVGVVYPFARPFNQSTTNCIGRRSGLSPTVGHPCQRPEPRASECTTANPRGTHSLMSACEIRVRVAEYGGFAMTPRGFGCASSSWLTSQFTCPREVPA